MSNASKPGSASGTKIQIEQNVPSGSIRKGPYAIERSVDPSNVVIKRRFGEGSKPLFQRDDIAVNVEHSSEHNCNKTSEACDFANTAPVRQWHGSKPRSASADSSSPERFRKRNDTHTSVHSRQSYYQGHENTSKQINSADRNATSPSQRRQKPNEKIPYFMDDVRERDRLRRIYGNGRAKSPHSYSRKRRIYSKSRSRSLSPAPSSRRSRAQHRKTSSTYRARSDSRERHKKPISRSARHRSRSLDERHKSRERRRPSPGHLSSVRHRRSSRSHSRTRSREREHEHKTKDTYNSIRHNEYQNAREPTGQTTPQIVTIPVPVPADYAYGYSPWPTPPHGHWGVGGYPPPRFPSFPMPTILPAGVMPTLRPPPYRMPPGYYGGRIFRPQQSRYGIFRPPRVNQRPRNY